MKITAAKVIVTSPGRNFVTLKIETDFGLSGLGDATLNGRELAVASYLTDHVVPMLIGRDAQRIEDTWQYLYRGAYWRREPVTMTAIGAVDTALWDLKAKQAGLPLYQLLGGACRDGVMVYGHANGETIEETVAQARRYIGMGYKAVRLPDRPSRDSPPPMASRATSCSMSRPAPPTRQNSSGRPRNTCPWRRRCSKPLAKLSAGMSTCSTTSTIGLPRSRRRAWERTSSPGDRSGSRTPLSPTIRKASG